MWQTLGMRSPSILPCMHKLTTIFLNAWRCACPLDCYSLELGMFIFWVPPRTPDSWQTGECSSTWKSKCNNSSSTIPFPQRQDIPCIGMDITLQLPKFSEMKSGSLGPLSDNGKEQEVTVLMGPDKRGHMHLTLTPMQTGCLGPTPPLT